MTDKKDVRAAPSRHPGDETVATARRSIENGHVPQQVFNDEDVFELELDRIFGNAWVFVGHESEIPEKGDYKLRYIGSDPYIFVRDHTDDINLLFNSCRHRGTEVCRSEKGNTSHFRCPYHGWTFKNTGELVGVPHREGFRDECIDLEDKDLFEAPRLDEYEGFYFASLAEDGEPLAEYIGAYSWFLETFVDVVEGGYEVIGDPHRTTIDANWKTCAENFAGDAYHLPTVHKSVFSLDAYQSGDESGSNGGEGGQGVARLVDCGKHGITVIPGRATLNYPTELLDFDALDAEQRAIYDNTNTIVGNLFPNCSFLVTPATHKGQRGTTALSVRKWRPIGPDAVEIWNWILVPKDASGEYKERAYDAMMATFSPSGNFEPDDYAVWSSVPDNADSITVKKHGLETFHGNREHLGGELDEGAGGNFSEADWPGNVDAVTASDMAGHTVYRTWVEMMSERR